MATVNGFMPGEWDWMDGGKPGAAPMMEGLLGNPALQMGLGILANNQGNYGAFGPAIGRGLSQGLQQVQHSKQMDMQHKLYQMKLKEFENEQTRQQAKQDFLKNWGQPNATEQSVTQTPDTFQNAPQYENAPNFNMTRVPGEQTVTETPFFDPNKALMAAVSSGALDFKDYLAFTQKDKKDPIKVSHGDILIDPVTKQPIYTAPQVPEKLPTDVQEYEYAVGQGYQGTFKDFQIEQKKAGASRITNAPVYKQESKEAEKVGEFFGNQYAEIQKAGLSAGGKINRVERMNQLLDGVNTGKLAPLGVEIASTAQSLGFNIDPKLGNKQAAEALANEMALEMRNPSGGAGMPGAMSDKDREFLKQIVPGIEKTPQGRKLITESMIKLANRDREVAKLARKYRSKRGTIDEGFFEELQAYSEANPLFGDNQKSATKFNRNMTSKDLKKGQAYVMPNGKTMVWNGLAFD